MAVEGPEITPQNRIRVEFTFRAGGGRFFTEWFDSQADLDTFLEANDGSNVWGTTPLVILGDEREQE